MASRILRGVRGSSDYAFETDVRRDQIVSVTFRDTTYGAPTDAIDISAVQDGSVLAWTYPNGRLFDLYVAAEGGVIAAENSSQMFRGFTNLKNVDLSKLETGNVTKMSQMFLGCSSLKKMDVSGFDTGKITTMQNMFSGCSGLTELDVSNFDISNVKNYSGFMDPNDTFNGKKWEKLFQ